MSMCVPCITASHVSVQPGALTLSAQRKETGTATPRVTPREENVPTAPEGFLLSLLFD